MRGSSCFFAPITSLDEYPASDVGGVVHQRVLELGPSATIAEVTGAGLRGWGGGGFLTTREGK